MIYQPLENYLAMKALAWNYEKGTFTSPQQADYVWDKETFKAAVCPRSQHEVPDANCYCGIHATFSLGILGNYVGASVISPIFLMESSGRTVLQRYGWRAAEVTLRWVVIPDRDDLAVYRLAAYQAADFFNVKILTLDQALMVMDFQNLLRYSEPPDGGVPIPLEKYPISSPTLAQIPRIELVRLAKSYLSTLA